LAGIGSVGAGNSSAIIVADQAARSGHLCNFAWHIAFNSRHRFDWLRMKMETRKMLIRLFGAAALCFALFPGCADTKQAKQTDSKSILQKAESDRGIHGEVGVMYGRGMH
jgi:hypothetical protein